MGAVVPAGGRNVRLAAARRVASAVGMWHNPGQLLDPVTGRARGRRADRLG